ncbi:hybrid sensor histidine kinase/response regulator [Nocardioides sp. URHA0020]|uniref:hybrid sensor histidine kinase/response regulator n=1 Tax=Nocardioides sp. URHA0020 TaxID=1380392 RepID=UPI000684B5A3|nr:ATP-binding protein [Nocardioides sp. URHA0020]
MDRSRRSLVVRALWVTELVVIAIHLGGPSGTSADATYLLGNLLPAVLAWLGTRWAPTRRRRLVPALLATSVTLAAVGDVLLVAHSRATGESDRSVADVPYLLGYLYLVGALVVVTVGRRGDRRVAPYALLDVVTVVVVSVLVVWTGTVDQLSGEDSSQQFGRLMWVAFPVLDAVLCGLALRALVHRRTRRAVGRPLAIGIWCWLAADLAYYALAMEGTFSAVPEAGWMLGGMVLATATLRPPVPPVAATPLDLEHARTGGRLLSASIPLLVPTVLWSLGADLGLVINPWTMLLGTVTLVALTFVRTGHLLRSESEARTELAAARDAALEGSRAKSDFLATMSHEIRTPMNGVIGLTGLLLGSELQERQRTYAEGVRTAGDALLAIINDVLDFSKVEAGHLELESIDFEPARVVAEVAGLVADPAGEKGIELLTSCSPALPARLLGDPSRLRQVLLNLAGNAVKFTESGQVVIRAEPVGTTTHWDQSGRRTVAADTWTVRFEVSDTGIGIDAADRSRLFDPFSQADSSTTRRYGGSGLGLAICHQLVDAMGGTLGVESEPGNGSRFWFTVPLGAAADRPAITASVAGVRRPQAVVVPTPPPRRGRILVVEDGDINQIVAEGIIRACGYDVDLADDGAAGLAAMAAQDYDLVFMDVQMPVMDGFSATREIRRREADGSRTPVIAMTASAVDGDRERCLAAGMDDYVSKPITRAAVTAVLERWVAGARVRT